MANAKARQAESYVYYVDGAPRIRTVDDLGIAYTIADQPLAWQAQGLQETATGYGRKLTSTRVLTFAGERPRRIYVTQVSNAGTAWIVRHGKMYVVRD